MTALLLALALAMPPGVHYQGTVGTGAGSAASAGIARDTGASTFPVTASANGNLSKLATAAFSTSASTTLLVVSVGFSNLTGTNQTPINMNWSDSAGNTVSAPTGASAWTKQASKVASFNSHTAQIFTATCSSALSGVYVTASGGATDVATAIAITVDALTGASTTMGNTATVANETGSASAVSTTITATAGSWLYAAASGENCNFSTTPTAATNFTNGAWVIQAASSEYAWTSYDGIGTSGSITAGWTSTAAYWQLAVLEIKAQ